MITFAKIDIQVRKVFDSKTWMTDHTKDRSLAMRSTNLVKRGQGISTHYRWKRQRGTIQYRVPHM